MLLMSLCTRHLTSTLTMTVLLIINYVCFHACVAKLIAGFRLLNEKLCLKQCSFENQTMK